MWKKSLTNFSHKELEYEFDYNEELAQSYRDLKSKLSGYLVSVPDFPKLSKPTLQRNNFEEVLQNELAYLRSIFSSKESKPSKNKTHLSPEEDFKLNSLVETIPFLILSAEANKTTLDLRTLDYLLNLLDQNIPLFKKELRYGNVLLSLVYILTNLYNNIPDTNENDKFKRKLSVVSEKIRGLVKDYKTQYPKDRFTKSKTTNNWFYEKTSPFDSYDINNDAYYTQFHSCGVRVRIGDSKITPIKVDFIPYNIAAPHILDTQLTLAMFYQGLKNLIYVIENDRLYIRDYEQVVNALTSYRMANIAQKITGLDIDYQRAALDYRDELQPGESIEEFLSKHKDYKVFLRGKIGKFIRHFKEFENSTSAVRIKKIVEELR